MTHLGWYERFGITQSSKQMDMFTWLRSYHKGYRRARYPVPALYAKTVWFPEGSPYVACPGIPYVNLLAYNGASNGIRHGYYTLKRYYIFWDSVVDYLTY